MSVITKRGDDCETDLLFGRRISKLDPRVAACGAVDELNAALGVIRACEVHATTRELIAAIQAKLVGLMGEFAVHSDDEAKYDEAGYPRISPEEVEWLETEAKSREKDWDVRFKGWAVPGKDATLGAANIDVARTVCRRAELSVIALSEVTFDRKPARLFLNRLSDLLWILARGESLALGDESM